MTQFTPGPWTIRKNETTRLVFVGNPDTTHSYPLFRDIGPCEANDQDWANARLVATSPKLVECLQELLEWREYMGGWEAPCWERAEQLVADLTAPTTEED